MTCPYYNSPTVRHKHEYFFSAAYYAFCSTRTDDMCKQGRSICVNYLLVAFASVKPGGGAQDIGLGGGNFTIFLG